MGFRFKRRFKLLPGVHINLSKSGISTSVGVKGAQITHGHGKTRTTFGLPGSGISHSSVTSDQATPTGQQLPRTGTGGEFWRGLFDGLGAVGIIAIAIVLFVILRMIFK